MKLAAFRLVVLLLLSQLSWAEPTTTVDQLVTGIKSKVRRMASERVCYQEYQDFKQRRGFKSLSYYDYLKSKLAFECTRDSGLWHIAYTITDREPNSKNIWAQWRTVRQPTSVTALGECDELSALYAFLARRLGVKGIGLFWPTSNHTVAVWTVEGQRVVVPTTPIFLERHDGFDAEGFDPETQAVIYDYTAPDVPGNYAIPEPLGRFFLSQVDRYGGASRELLHELRYLREQIQRTPGRPPTLESLSPLIQTEADRKAVRAFRRQFRLAR